MEPNPAQGEEGAVHRGCFISVIQQAQADYGSCQLKAAFRW